MNRIRISINLLCVLILAIIGISCALNIGTFSIGLVQGFADESNPAMNSQILLPANLISDNVIDPVPADTIVGADGTLIPLVIEQASVFVSAKSVSAPVIISTFIINVAVVVVFVFLLVYLLKFIVGVNKGLIFVQRNVRLLRKIGICMIIMGVSQYAAAVVCNTVLAAIICWPDHYAQSLMSALPWTDILVGLVALLMSEIWKCGLVLQNESELTV